MTDPYSPTVRALFAEPRHGGRLSGDGTFSVHTGDRSAGAEVALSARALDGAIQELRYLAWGCPHLLAACEYTCRKLCGRSATELAPVAHNELAGILELPVEKTGNLLLIEDAIRALKSKLIQDRDFT